MELKNIYQFSSVDEDSLNIIEGMSVRKSFKKGDIVFYEGDRGENITILSKGLLKVFKSDAKGNEITIHLFAEPTMVAEMPIFEGIPYPATARFETDGEMFFIEYKKFKEMLESNSKLGFSIIRSLTKKLKYLENNMTNIVGRTALEKIAKFLYDNEEMLPQIKGYAIAGAVNVTPETMSRELKKLKADNIVKTDGQKIVVLDRARLKKKFN